MIDIASDLDLYEDEAVEIVKKIKELQEITLAESEFSRQFTIPATNKNNEVFSFYANIDVDSTINPHKSIDAFWTVDLSTRYTGVLEIKGCTYKDGLPASYSLVFYGKIKGLASVFAQDRLIDIDWSALDHTLNQTNLLASWAGTFLSGDITYPLVDYARNFFFGPSSLSIDGNIANAANGIRFGDLKPAIKFRKFIQTIFENYGLTVTGTIDDVEFDDMFLLPNNAAGVSLDYDFYAANYVQVRTDTGQDVTSTTPSIIELDTEEEDENNNFDPTTFTYTAPITGSYTFVLYFTASKLIAGPGTISVQTGFKVNGGDLEQSAFSFETDGTGTPELSTERYFNVSLTDGDEVTFFIGLGTLSNNVRLGFARMSTLDFPTTEESVDRRIVDTMPDDSVVEFLNKTLKAFRWLIVPGTTEGSWQLLSEADWREDGASRDWSNYIDLETISYQKPNVYKEVRLTTAESESAVQTAFEELANRRFGEVRITPDVDFGQPELLIESPFVLWPESFLNVLNEESEIIGSTGIPIYKMLDVEGSSTKDKFLLFYFNGIMATPYPYYLQSGSSGGDPTYALTGVYPSCKFYNEISIPDNDTYSTTYSIENTFIGDPPLDNFYTRYWQTQLYNLYATGARVCTAEFYLPMDQFLSFELNDTIFCEGRRWYIDELKYNTLTKSTKATLRSKDPLKARSTVTTIKGSGKVNFDDTPDVFVLSEYNTGLDQGGEYLLRNPKSGLLNNKILYTKAATEIFQTYITNIINVINDNLLSWGES